MMLAKQRSQSREVINRSRRASDEEPIARRQAESAYTQEVVAELTTSVIEQMERDELIEVIRSVQIPFLRAESLRRLEHWDTPTLRRVVHLACRCYRPQYY